MRSRRLFEWVVAMAAASLVCCDGPLQAALMDDVVAAWLFDEGQGDTVADLLGENHGAFNGNVGWSDEGRFGAALSLPGEFGSWVEIPHAEELSLETWTITAWVRLEPPVDTNDGWAIILVKDPANGFQNYALDLSPQGNVVAEVTSGGGWSNCTSFTTVYDDEWHFVAGSYDGEFLSVWVDGELEGQQEFGPGDLNDAPLAIGNRLDDSQPVFGLIDDLALFNRALDEEDLVVLMEQGVQQALGLGTVPGDFDGSGALDIADLNDLTTQAASGNHPAGYDLNADGSVDGNDVTVWVRDLFKSWIGDVNLDGVFNSSDLVSVLASGTYEVDVASVWSTGDFNGDGRTNSSDLVAALSDGGYEEGPRLPAAVPVPEPSTVVLVMVAWLAAALRSAPPLAPPHSLRSRGGGS